ncbi:MAG TPA: alpha/beta hydrolase-fold protein [Actinomycetales bacterium]|nr:alpha/beta hydrolase-fold protein [Actinomycetales bacterium]
MSSDQLLARLAQPSGFWTTPWPGTLLAVAAVVVLAGYLALRHRRLTGRLGRHRVGVPRRGFAIAAIATSCLLGLLSGGAFVNAFVGYLPTNAAIAQALGLSQVGAAPPAPPVQRDSAAIGAAPASVSRSANSRGTLLRQTSAGQGPGTVVQADLPAPGLGVTAGSTYIYLPPGYASATGRYPVIYLIHGSPGSPQDWFRAAQAAQIATALIHANLMPPAILVAVDANGNQGFLHDTECLDAVHGAQVETYLSSTVVHYVDSHFRTLPDPGDRVIGGMSSGGYCAMNLGLRHRDVYSTVLAMEPYGTPGTPALQRLLAGNQALYRANSPTSYLPTMRFSHPMAFFVDVGANSSPHSARALDHLLTARGQLVEYRVEPGVGHTWNEARAGLPYALAFAGRMLSAAPAP